MQGAEAVCRRAGTEPPIKRAMDVLCLVIRLWAVVFSFWLLPTRLLYLIAPLISSIIPVAMFERERIATLLRPKGVSPHADVDRP